MDAIAPDPLEPPPPPALPRRIHRRSPLAAGILGWVLPGLGQLYAGRPGKALVLAATIGGLFYGGWAMTGFTAVDPETYGLEFVAHAWMGGPTAAAYWTSRDVILTDPMPWLEVGRLYAAVAGLLNIVAICDALGGVLEHNVRAEDRATLRQQLVQQHEDAVARVHAARLAAEALPPDTLPPDTLPPDTLPPDTLPPEAPPPDPSSGQLRDTPLDLPFDVRLPSDLEEPR